ncbi:hypothetical protein ACFWU5_16830 [Nocardia sp. NPDC058640]|uniref:hypothetical protein n=1 Tax=Nocardia sp. NPDC058640 TaxID=3346571 RepID=UPI003663946E
MNTALAPRTIDTKRYRWRKANNIVLYTSSTLVRQHITELAALDVTPQMIAYVVDCDRQAIQAIATNARIRIDFAARILTVSPHPHPSQRHVLATGARRRICALQALGWPRRILGEHLDVNSSIISQLCTQTHTSYTRWLAVRNLYEELSATRGPSNHVASTAHRAGHPPPLAWEGSDIDHPLAPPDWAAAGITLRNRSECTRGHPYTPANTWRRSNGNRICRTCNRATKRSRTAA